MPRPGTRKSGAISVSGAAPPATWNLPYPQTMSYRILSEDKAVRCDPPSDAVFQQEVAAEGLDQYEIDVVDGNQGGCGRLKAERFKRLYPDKMVIAYEGTAGADPSAVARKPFWEQEPKDWEPFLGTNLFGVLNCVRIAGPGMIANKYGKIVTVISDAGRVGEPHLQIYSGAKAGAAGFMRAVAKDLGRAGITANCVALGATRTPAIERATSDPEAVKRMLKVYQIKRIGEPEDAANMILFLSSDASSWITGQTIPVNGGYSFAM